MSTEIIKSIRVLPDGVYLESKSENTDGDYHNWRSDSLSKVFAGEGQEGLDREIIGMLYEYAKLEGACKSIQRYRYALELAESCGIYQRYTTCRNKRFQDLSPEDQNSVLYGGQDRTPRAKSFIQVEKQKKTEVYTQIAQYCVTYEKLQSRPSDKKYPAELVTLHHPSIQATFTEDYDIGGVVPPRYKKGEHICLVWVPNQRGTGCYAECENGSFPIPAEDFNRVLIYEISPF